jgi:hypothetical protein
VPEGRPLSGGGRPLAQRGSRVRERVRRRSSDRSTSPDALELTILIARKDPRRHPRVAARWLLRYLEEHPEATIDEAALAASCLAALRVYGQAEAARALRAMAERATRRRRGRGVA